MTTEPTDTPLTKARAFKILDSLQSGTRLVVDAEHHAELERQLTAARIDLQKTAVSALDMDCEINSLSEQLTAAKELLREIRDELTELRMAADGMKEALINSMTALDDWTHVYAPEFCGEDHVAETRDRIWNEGGTLAFIAGTQESNRIALTAYAAISEAKPKVG